MLSPNSVRQGMGLDPYYCFGQHDYEHVGVWVPGSSGWPYGQYVHQERCKRCGQVKVA